MGGEKVETKKGMGGEKGEIDKKGRGVGGDKERVEEVVVR